MAKKVQLMTNPKQWQTVDGVEVLIDVPQEDIDPVTDSSCVEIEGHRTLEETINEDNAFSPEIIETKVSSKVGGVYHDNVMNGAYEQAILYGNTQVNLVESVTTGTKYIPHSFTSFQGNESKIGNYHSGRTNQVAPLIKGVTMVNLAQTTSVTILEGSSSVIENIKSNTEYTLALDFTVQNTQKGFSIQSFKDDTYLETATIRTEMGEKVKFTFTTHGEANRIYIVNNSGYGGEIQLDNIMVIEGDVTDLDLPFFKGMRSVELSRPLTNLFTDDLRTESLLGGTATNSGGTVVATAESIGTWKGMAYFLDNKLKPNTKYLIMWDSLTQTQTSTTNTDVIIGAYHHDGDTVTTRLGTINANPLCPVMRSIVFDTGNYDVTQISIRIHATTSNSETGVTTVTGLRVFEWDDSLRSVDLQSLGYFSGTKYVSARTLETVGKNLYPYGDINFTNDYVGWCDAKGKTNMYGDIAQKSSTRFLLKKGTYTFSFGETTNTTYLALVDDKEQSHGSSVSEERTFTLSQDTYMTLRLKTVEANVATTVTNIQIERGETATTYEAYLSRYYKPRETEEIILRSLPNGVCDTFNLQTGELVQNICYLTVTSGFTALSHYTTDTHATFAWSLSSNGVECSNHTVFYSNYIRCNTYTTDSVEGVAINSAGNQLTVRIERAKYADYGSFNAYLTDNPLIIQYALKEPIVTKLQTYDRIHNGQTNGLANMGNNLSALTYNYSNSKILIGNLSPIPPIVEPITILPYNVRLKANTDYTLKYNRGNSSSMTFDLGGTSATQSVSIGTNSIQEELLIKTPVILSHNQLILSGSGYAYNFVIVEGDIRGKELPYFEGMKDVKMPIVKNIGKNLFHGGFELGTINSSDGSYGDSTDGMRGLEYIRIIGGKTYVIACDDSTYRFAYVCYDKDKKFLRTSGGYYSGQTYKPQGDVEYVIMRTPNGQSMNNPHVKLALYEYEEGMDTTLQDYKENSIYAVQGEYPFSEDMFGQGSINSYSSSAGQEFIVNQGIGTRVCLKSLLRVKIGTTYMIHANSGYQVQTYSYTIDNKVPTIPYATDWGQESVFVAQDNKLLITIRKKDNSTITPSVFDNCGLKMYELDSTINLRSLPNGVKDELNLLTGEYIQRVGEVILDENESWSQDITASESTPNTNIFYTAKHQDFKPLATTQRESGLLCDKMKVIASLFSLDVVGVMTNLDPRAYIRLPKNIAPDVASLKTYLQSNPVTVQYELAEPITSHVRLVSNNQEREVGVKLPNGVCNTYNPSTGITTVRVGKVVLDGSEDWDVYDQAPSNLDYFRLPIPTMFSTGNMNADKETECKYVVSDTFPTVGYYAIQKANSTINYSVISGMYSSSLGVQCLYVYYKPSADLATFKAYLASNPITVWYQLKHPQIQPDIVLPNGVHDEYNPETGVYTKRIGFIEFDGSADEGWEKRVWDTQPLYSMFNIPSDYAVPTQSVNNVNIISNSLPSDYDQWNNGGESITVFKTPSRISITYDATKISTVDDLRTYLSQNPLKAWYELETPITYQLTPYFGLPTPYAYEDGYLIHDSAYPDTTLPPEFSYKLVTNRTGQIIQNNIKLKQHTTRLSNLEALIIEATIQSLFDRELQLFELELMDIQLIDLGE